MTRWTPPDAEPHRARVALDGLDQPPWRNRTVVVMCRTEVYARLRDLRGDAGLHGATTITLQPMSPIDIGDYLHHHRDQLGIAHEAWAAVTDQIGHDPDGPLTTALRTPWLLGLAAAALRRDWRTATQLAECRDTAEVRDLLFTALIPAAIHARPRTGPTRDYTEQNVQTWMHTLAHHLQHRRAEGTGGTEIALDQVWVIAGTRRCRALHGLASGLMFGLISWLVFGLINGLMVGLGVGLLFGLINGLIVGLTSKKTVPTRLAWRVPGRSRWRRVLAVGLMVGLAVGLAVGLLFGLRYGLTVGLPFGLLFGLLFGLRISSADRLALGQDAQRVIHDGLMAGLMYGLTAGLVYGLMVGLMVVLMVGLAGFPSGLLWLGFGLVLALLIGLRYGGTAVRYASASLVFIFTETFAPRPAQFLEWARNAGLLRVTGIAYQYRHDSYQQWLADHPHRPL